MIKRPFDELRDLVLIVKLRVLEPVERPDRKRQI